MPFESLGQALHRTYVRNAPQKEQLVSARVVYLARTIVDHRWSADQAVFVRVVSFSEGKLVLEATVGAAVQALKLETVSIRNAINRELGGPVVQLVEVRQAAPSTSVMGNIG